MGAGAVRRVGPGNSRRGGPRVPVGGPPGSFCHLRTDRREHWLDLGEIGRASCRERVYGWGGAEAAEDGIGDDLVTGVQTCALPISGPTRRTAPAPILRTEQDGSRGGSPRWPWQFPTGRTPCSCRRSSGEFLPPPHRPQRALVGSRRDRKSVV